MGTLLKLLLRFHAIILFLLLETAAVTLLSYGSYYQHSRLFAAMQTVQSFCGDMVGRVTEYIGLRQYNEKLLAENARLRNRLDYYEQADTSRFVLQSADALGGKQMSYRSAKVVGGSTNRQYNLLTLNVGEWEGVQPEMGVVSDDGVVGIVLNTSAHYSTVMSLLNRDFRISGRLRRTGYLGTVLWDGRNYREVMLQEVPQHVDVRVGDTVETSGYSVMFPEGIFIGTVSSYSTQKGNFHEIRLRLNIDFKRLRYVNVVKFMHHDEYRALQEKSEQ